MTANGEVQTNEEAQVYVQDIDLFVTVQLLEETPAVPSLGKLCSEHGCSYEWKNGEISRLTKNGKTITCKMDNFAPLVVPGLSSSSCSSSATSRPKDQSNSFGKSETSSDPMTTRSAKHACGKPMQTNPDKQASVNRGSAHKEDEMNEEDPTQGIPDGLQPFTDNLEDLETHVPAHSSEREISDSEGDASKVVTQKRKHRDRNCDHMLENQNYEGSLQKTQWGIYSTSRKVWWPDNSGSQSPQRRKWIPEQNHRYADVVQDLATQWIQSYPCKNKKFAGDGEEESTKVSRAVTKAKVICTDNTLELGKYCEELSWNHRTSTPYRSETNGIAERAVRHVSFTLRQLSGQFGDAAHPVLA